jgi:hypothetical protein
MHKWTYFASGIMAGVVAVLGTAVAMQSGSAQAFAAPLPPQATDNTGQGIALATGGSQPQTNDILWVIYKRHAPAKAGDGKDALVKDERITLCCYSIANGARQMKFVAARDISFDLDVIEFANDKPRVKDIVDELKKALPRDK